MEMDFHGMKRKRLQALCKKHGIPANLKNKEMADRLSFIFKVKEIEDSGDAGTEKDTRNCAGSEDMLNVEMIDLVTPSPGLEERSELSANNLQGSEIERLDFEANLSSEITREGFGICSGEEDMKSGLHKEQIVSSQGGLDSVPSVVGLEEFNKHLAEEEVEKLGDNNNLLEDVCENGKGRDEAVEKDEHNGPQVSNGPDGKTSLIEEHSSDDVPSSLNKYSVGKPDQFQRTCPENEVKSSGLNIHQDDLPSSLNKYSVRTPDQFQRTFPENEVKSSGLNIHQDEVPFSLNKYSVGTPNQQVIYAASSIKDSNNEDLVHVLSVEVGEHLSEGEVEKSGLISESEEVDIGAYDVQDNMKIGDIKDPDDVSQQVIYEASSVENFNKEDLVQFSSVEVGDHLLDEEIEKCGLVADSEEVDIGVYDVEDDMKIDDSQQVIHAPSSIMVSNSEDLVHFSSVEVGDGLLEGKVENSVQFAASEQVGTGIYDLENKIGVNKELDDDNQQVIHAPSSVKDLNREDLVLFSSREVGDHFLEGEDEKTRVVADSKELDIGVYDVEDNMKIDVIKEQVDDSQKVIHAPSSVMVSNNEHLVHVSSVEAGDRLLEGKVEKSGLFTPSEEVDIGAYDMEDNIKINVNKELDGDSQMHAPSSVKDLNKEDLVQFSSVAVGDQLEGEVEKSGLLADSEEVIGICDVKEIVENEVNKEQVDDRQHVIEASSGVVVLNNKDLAQVASMEAGDQLLEGEVEKSGLLADSEEIIGICDLKEIVQIDVSKDQFDDTQQVIDATSSVMVLNNKDLVQTASVEVGDHLMEEEVEKSGLIADSEEVDYVEDNMKIDVIMEQDNESEQVIHEAPSVKDLNKEDVIQFSLVEIGDPLLEGEVEKSGLIADSEGVDTGISEVKENVQIEVGKEQVDDSKQLIDAASSEMVLNNEDLVQAASVEVGDHLLEGEVEKSGLLSDSEEVDIRVDDGEDNMKIGVIMEQEDESKQVLHLFEGEIEKSSLIYDSVGVDTGISEVKENVQIEVSKKQVIDAASSEMVLNIEDLVQVASVEVGDHLLEGEVEKSGLLSDSEEVDIGVDDGEDNMKIDVIIEQEDESNQVLREASSVNKEDVVRFSLVEIGDHLFEIEVEKFGLIADSEGVDTGICDVKENVQIEVSKEQVDDSQQVIDAASSVMILNNEDLARVASLEVGGLLLEEEVEKSGLIADSEECIGYLPNDLETLASKDFHTETYFDPCTPRDVATCNIEESRQSNQMETEYSQAVFHMANELVLLNRSMEETNSVQVTRLFDNSEVHDCADGIGAEDESQHYIGRDMDGVKKYVLNDFHSIDDASDQNSDVKADDYAPNKPETGETKSCTFNLQISASGTVSGEEGTFQEKLETPPKCTIAKLLESPVKKELKIVSSLPVKRARDFLGASDMKENIKIAKKEQVGTTTISRSAFPKRKPLQDLQQN
ncbi:hypothetical protein VNO78_33023 [Psophocarpus tetragonolobus]|uniref:Uncharacterized protein n=1 Tax=Psophocarpus tetragonolobus TaxID=3891 RepID=A0AAN9RKZ6_PSOTE